MADANATCLVPGCAVERKGLGYCSAHYQRVKKYGDPRSDVPVRARGSMSGTCTVSGCDREISQRTLGLCRPHYHRVWRDGSADLSSPILPPRAKPVPVKDFEDGTRECQECKARKSLDEFHKDVRSPGGRRKTCKMCRVDREARRYWVNPDGHRERMRAFRSENIEHVRAREARYYEQNREARIDAAVANAHKRRASLYASRRDAGISRKSLRLLDGDCCCYCGVSMIFASFPKGGRPDNQATIEHIVPLSRGGSHTWGNCALACWRCNITKGARDGDWRIRFGHRLSSGRVEVGSRDDKGLHPGSGRREAIPSNRAVSGSAG